MSDTYLRRRRQRLAATRAISTLASAQAGPASATGKRGGKVIKPWHNLYANHAGDKWRVHEALPTDWPTKVKRFAAAQRSAAFGPRTQVPWFMYYANDKFNPGSPNSVFLYHPDRGYAARSGGPARLP